MAIKIGDVAGDYKVIAFAGSGGMGSVYKIEHLITKRVEAMKLLPAGIGSDPGQVQRFEREIQVQARLHHPNIAALYNAVRDGSSVALIMEYVEGESLQRILERGCLPLSTAVDYAGQVLDALAYAHGEGVIHRDVAPANIIITPEGVAKLTDFGLARAATDPRLSTSGVAVGSPWYMSPEQVRGVAEPDARTDIYSTGAVLHEMLTGRKLFDADGAFAIMCAQTGAVPQPPSAWNPEVSAALDGVVARALAKNPAARFRSAGEFRQALGAAVGVRPSAIPASSLGAARPWSATILLAIAPAPLVAMMGTMLLWPRTPHIVAQARISADRRAPVIVIAPPASAPPAEAAVSAPEVPVVAAVRSPRRSSQPDRSLSIRVSGGAVESRSAVPPPNPPRSVTASAPQPQESEAIEPPAAPPAPEARSSAEPASSERAPDEAKPPKTGNRFVRALGKINPFRRGTSSADDESLKAPAKRN